jgi:hypothetical protein
VPWADITAIAVWQQLPPGGGAVTCVGLARRSAAPAGLAAAGGTRVAEVPLAVLAASRPVRGWQLDRRSLAKATAQLAPGVPVLDYDTGLPVSPDWSAGQQH